MKKMLLSLVVATSIGIGAIATYGLQQYQSKNNNTENVSVINKTNTTNKTNLYCDAGGLKKFVDSEIVTCQLDLEFAKPLGLKFAKPFVIFYFSHTNDYFIFEVGKRLHLIENGSNFNEIYELKYKTQDSRIVGDEFKVENKSKLYCSYGFITTSHNVRVCTLAYDWVPITIYVMPSGHYSIIMNQYNEEDILLKSGTNFDDTYELVEMIKKNKK